MTTGEPQLSASAGEDLTQSLFDTASAYLRAGWSVIPVHGTGAAPKAPAINSWKRYQQQRPTLADLQSWFLERHFAGVAVICGAVSRLAVLDFDDSLLAEQFAQQYPDLVETFTVQSGGRGLPHYYFALPDGMAVFGRSIPGVDLRANGQYVVAPPTPSPSGGWRLSTLLPPRPLTFSDFERILAFMRAVDGQTPQNRVKSPSRAIPAVSAAAVQSRLNAAAASMRSSASQAAPVEQTASPRKHTLTANKLLGFYRERCSAGRNNALFAAATFARDCGWSADETRRALLPAHVAQPPNHAHAPETASQRQQEAARTIASAFTHAPRQRSSIPTITGLPNNLREALLAQGTAATAAARLLDALLYAGWKAGAEFTERRAETVATAAGIGRRSLRAALAAALKTANGTYALFQRETTGCKTAALTPPPPPERQANAAIQTPPVPPQCVVGRGKKRVKNSVPKGTLKPRGRPPRCYVLPDPLALCVLLGVPAQTSDTLAAADLRSPAAYRQAQHRELIRRRPGQYGRRWLAARLGVSKQTVRRYDRSIGVRVQPVYSSRLLTATQVYALPRDSAGQQSAGQHAGLRKGQFLEDARGKRYPVVQGAGLRLLRESPTVLHKQQQPNYYAFGAVIPASLLPATPALVQRPRMPHTAVHPFVPVSRAPARADAPHARTGKIPARVFVPLNPAHSGAIAPGYRTSAPSAALHNPHRHLLRRLKRRLARHRSGAAAIPRKQLTLWSARVPECSQPAPPSPRSAVPLADPLLEATAMQVYAALRQHSPQKALSKANVRALVQTYGAPALKRALGVMQRRNVSSPAGFLIAFLRSEYGRREWHQSSTVS